MKTFQRILAVVLALVMSLSVIGVAAFAAENTDDTITGTSGSITIHKFEYNVDDKNPAGSEGTGADNDNVPSGAKPLNGAGFTIYKVENIDYLTTYYGTGTVAQPVVSTYTENGAIKEGYAGNVVKYKETVDGVEVEKTEKVTGADGTVSFTGLELGLYVVIETTTPDSVTEPCEPFLVSVPMTTVDGSGWLYDIHVYPKNGTSYGKVTLVKKGDDVASGLVGVTFVLQKQDGTDDDGNTKWIDITKQSGAQGDNTGTALNLVTNSEGKIVVEGLSNGTYRFIETDLGENKNGGYILDGATAYTFTVTDGMITYNNNTSDTAEIEVVNEKPTLDKEVKNDEGNWGNAADYSVGDTIPYRITVDVPSNVASLRTFTVTDTPTNLVDDVSSIVIKKADNTVIFDNTDQNDENNIGAKEGNGFKIEFNSYEDGDVTSALANYAGQQIVIEYNAVLQTSAEIDDDGNPNTAELKYSNAIYPTGDPTNPNNGGEPKEDKITDQAIVYTFKLDVLKTNESSTPLKDVEFDLYLYNGTGTVTEALLESTGTKIGSYTTGEDGKISVSGLENGNYYLVETKTNAGYNLLKSPVKVEINVVYAVETETKTTYNESGDVIATEVSTKTFTEKNGTENDGIFGTTIINKTGFTLPQTGGIGTLMFILMGGVLIAGGICLIAVPNKKRSV